jgi:hypothetical protein
MSEKVLNEFTLRLTKAKNQLQDTTNQCELLRKEAIRLKKVRKILKLIPTFKLPNQ